MDLDALNVHEARAFEIKIFTGKIISVAGAAETFLAIREAATSSFYKPRIAERLRANYVLKTR